jgi:hypothetical protein
MPVMKADVPEDAEVLRCFIFLVEKFLANGEFDKIKARLVANRAQQNRELYPNKSSPTASIHAILTCFALVAYIGRYKVAKIDVKGAYIQTEITGSPIYMKMVAFNLDNYGIGRLKKFYAEKDTQQLQLIHAFLRKQLKVCYFY